MTREEAKKHFIRASDNASSYFDSTEVVSVSSCILILKKIYDDFENQKCANCKHLYIKFGEFIYCRHFEQSFPIEIGKCDLWEGKE